MPSDAAPTPLGVLLISGGYDRAHYAMVMVASAAAIGRPAVLFATNDGCRAFDAAWAAASEAEHDAEYRRRGVAGLRELREAAAELGVRMIACEAGLRVSGQDASGLLPGVEIAGVATFLGATAGGQLISL